MVKSDAVLESIPALLARNAATFGDKAAYREKEYGIWQRWNWGQVAEQVESMGAQFVFLDFDEEQKDGSETGGYAAVSSPEFAAAQLAKFREIAPDMDIVITTALIPNREAPELWTEDMVKSMKPGSVIVDLAAENAQSA